MPVFASKILAQLGISAASGLVKLGESFFVVADDDLELLERKKDGREVRYPLFSGRLPDDYKERKKRKPDLESLFVHGEIITALPSFSKPNRCIGATFDVSKKVASTLDLTHLHHLLSQEFKDVNIEGSVVWKDDVWLFQRGNGIHRENGIVVVDKNLATIKKVMRVDLGELHGMALGFTDACLDLDQLYFLAVAEQTTSTYDDGDFAGAIMGIMSEEGKILTSGLLDVKYKPEGLWVEGSTAYMVTDADDRKIQAQLLEVPKPTIP